MYINFVDKDFMLVVVVVVVVVFFKVKKRKRKRVRVVRALDLQFGSRRRAQVAL